MAAVAPVAVPAFSPPAVAGMRVRRGAARARRASVSVEALSFAAAPAVAAAMGFAAGVLLAARWWTPPGLLLAGTVALAGVCTVAACRAGRVAVAALVVLFAVLGALVTEAAPGVPAQRELAVVADGKQRVVEGVVERYEQPQRAKYTATFGRGTREELTQHVDVRVTGVDGQPLSGGVRLNLYAPVGATLPPVRCGSRMRLPVSLHAEGRYLDPGVWDTGAYLREQGVGAMGSGAADKLALLGAEQPTWGCRLHGWQSAASARVQTLGTLPAAAHLPAWLRLDSEDTSMLAAMLTGDRTALTHATRVGFERTGSFHLLVVSGMHLAIFAGVVFGGARRLRVPEVGATFVTLALSLGYALFTGFGEPVRRSLLMVALFLLGRLLLRDRHALQALSLASLLLMAANPRALFGASLQMTLLSVVALAGVAAPLVERGVAPWLRASRRLWLVPLDSAMPPRQAAYRVTLGLLAEHAEPVIGRWGARELLPFCVRVGWQGAELLMASLVIELAMTLPMAEYFHRITVMSLPVNFLLVPFLGLLLPAALGTFAVLLIWPAAAVVPAAGTALLLHCVEAVVHGFAAVRAGDLRVPGPPEPRVWLWLLLLSVAVWAVRNQRVWVAAAGGPALLAAAGLLPLLPQPVRHTPGALEVTAIDVGQGDALLVISPDGRSLLVDAGGLVGAGGEANAGRFDMGEDVVSPVLWARGIERLDAVAITHAHMDHIGGMPAVVANFHPRELWVGDNPHSREYDALMAEVREVGVPVIEHRAGDRWRLGGIDVEALWPSRTYVPRREPGNNDSLVLRVSYGATSALLEGDAEAPAEEGMLASGLLGHADLLKVGHHGSRSSTTPAFLAAVRPEYGVISVGRRNFYGHPRRETLDALEGAHVKTYLTETTGATSFALDGQQVRAMPWAAEDHGWLEGWVQ